MKAKESSSSERLSLVEKKDLGAFYTPREMTDFAVAWAVMDQRASVLDPGCGDAAFLLSAAKRLEVLGAKKADVARQVFGIDLNADAARTAAAELEKIGVKGAEMLHANFFKIGADLFEKRARMVDALVGNPPYVRYQLFREDNRAAGLHAAARAGVVLPQLSSSWAPYVVHAATFLKEGGRMALVLPGELLHVGYAAAVRQFLLRTFSNVTIVTFEEKVFPGALEEVVMLLGTKGTGDGKLRVRRLTSLQDLEDGPAKVLSKVRVCEVAPGQRWLTSLFETDAIGETQSMIERANFHPLGELGRIDIGVVTGANEFFVLGKNEVAEHRLPVSALLEAVSKASHVRGAKFTFLDWSAQLETGAPSYLLVLNDAALSGPVKEYIAKGERDGLKKRYKCRVREPWYRVPYVRRPELFLTYMSNIAPRLVVNEVRASHTNTIHGVFLTDPLLAEPLAAAFLNSATLLSAEIQGRSYGGGVLKLEPTEAASVLVPKLTPKLCEQLTAALPKVDEFVRQGHIDEASVVVDRIVLAKHFTQADVEKIRSVLSAMRARRLGRGKPNKKR